MKKSFCSHNRGEINLLVLLSLLLLSVALPAATTLVKQRQEIRKEAAGECYYQDDDDHPCNTHMPGWSTCDSTGRWGCDESCNFVDLPETWEEGGIHKTCIGGTVTIVTPTPGDGGGGGEGERCSGNRNSCDGKKVNDYWCERQGNGNYTIYVCDGNCVPRRVLFGSLLWGGEMKYCDESGKIQAAPVVNRDAKCDPQERKNACPADQFCNNETNKCTDFSNRCSSQGDEAGCLGVGYCVWNDSSCQLFPEGFCARRETLGCITDNKSKYQCEWVGERCMPKKESSGASSGGSGGGTSGGGTSGGGTSGGGGGYREWLWGRVLLPGGTGIYPGRTEVTYNGKAFGWEDSGSKKPWDDKLNGYNFGVRTETGVDYTLTLTPPLGYGCESWEFWSAKDNGQTYYNTGTGCSLKQRHRRYGSRVYFHLTSAAEGSPSVSPTPTLAPPTLSCPWTAVDMNNLPGTGKVESQSDVVVGNTLYQTVWQGGQGYGRRVPIVNNAADWENATPWTAVDMNNLPGTGKVESQSDVVVGNTLYQTVWQGGQGYGKRVPIVGGMPNWECLSTSYTFNFKVRLEGINQKRENRKLQVSLRQGEQEKYRFDVLVIANDEGIYEGVVFNIEPGTYDVFIKGWAHLRRKMGTINISTTLVKNGKDWSGIILKAGDAVPNNKVDIYDYNLLVSHFGSRMPAEGSNADFDLDKDVDIYDYNILVGNFGQSGVK